MSEGFAIKIKVFECFEGIFGSGQVANPDFTGLVEFADVLQSINTEIYRKSEF